MATRKYTIDVLDDAGQEVKRVFTAQPKVGESPVSAELAAVLDAAFRPVPAPAPTPAPEPGTVTPPPPVSPPIVTPPVVVLPPPVVVPPRPAGIHVSQGDNWAEAVRSAKPGDTVWLAAGGVWTTQLADTALRLKGVTIAAYGDGPAPLITVNKGSALTLWRAIELVINGIRFSARQPTAQGVRLLGCEVTVLNGCEITGFTIGLAAEAFGANRGKALNMVNCDVHDNYSQTGDDSHGVYVDACDGIQVRGGRYHHNGWRESQPAGASRMRNHNLYITGESRQLSVTEARISAACSHGLQARCGGQIVGNQFIDNPIHMSFGLVNGAGPIVPGGVTGKITRNLFLGERPLGSDVGVIERRGWAIEASNVKEAEISGNVFANNGPANPQASQAAIKLDLCRLTGKDASTPHPQAKQVIKIGKLAIFENSCTWPSNAPGGPVWVGAACDELRQQSSWPAVDVAAVRASVR